MDRHTNPRLNRRYLEQADADYWLGPKGKDMGWAALHPTQIHPHRNPAKSGILRVTSNGDEERSNPVSFSETRVCPGVGVNRIRRSGGIPQEANAAGKAGRYADVGTVLCR